MAKKKKRLYHAFTDAFDELFTSYKAARKCISEWKKEGHTNLRIYEVMDGDESIEDGNCLYSKGDFPY